MMTKKEEQKEILQLLTEECAEVIQAISKINRFGLETIYKGGATKKAEFQQEVGDVLAIILVLTSKYPELLDERSLAFAVRKKLVKLKRVCEFLKNLDLNEFENEVIKNEEGSDV